MTVSISSRYRTLGVIDAPDAAGVLHPTVPIRRHDPVSQARSVYNHRVTGAEVIDYLAWRTLGAGEQWWRLADANRLAFPLDLVPGQALSLPAREVVGMLPSRERVFR